MINNFLTNQVSVLACKNEGIELHKLLKSKSLSHQMHSSIESLTHSISCSSVLILTKELFTNPAIDYLNAQLSLQPSWSQISILLLIDKNDLSDSSFLKQVSLIHNLIILERPTPNETLLSVIQNCFHNRQQQLQVRDLLHQIEMSKTEVEQAEKAKNNFLANMSHEIRTPLGAVMGFSDLICQPRLSADEREEYALTIKRNGQQLTNLIEDILDIVKAESGKLNIIEQECNLDALLTEVTNTLRFRSLLKNVPIVIQKAEDVPSLIKTDATRLKQILSNLAQNAIKFTTEGKVIIKISTQGSSLVFEIIDTGIGIAKENHGKLFQAFFQADNSVTKKFGGTGLGLALSKKLAKALGGDLQLKSSYLGQGSRFQFSIKLVEPQQLNLFPNPFSANKKELNPLSGLKILVADDSEDNQCLLKQILTREGAVVETADNGEEAVNKALEDDYNVVLMDVQMPKLSGLEATKKLRQEGYPKPIVALSAFAMMEDRLRGLSAGCDLYLTKPVDKNKLVHLLQNYSRKTHSISSSRFSNQYFE